MTSTRTKAAARAYAFRNSYRDGKFYPFEYNMAELDGRESDVEFNEWADALDLNKTQQALLERMLEEIDVAFAFRREDDEHNSPVDLVFFSDPQGTIAVAEAIPMIVNAFNEADVSSLAAVRKSRDMVVAEAANYEKRMSEEWPDDWKPE